MKCERCGAPAPADKSICFRCFYQGLKADCRNISRAEAEERIRAELEEGSPFTPQMFQLCIRYRIVINEIVTKCEEAKNG